MGGAWSGIDAIGGLGLDADDDVDASAVCSSSLSPFFFFPNRVSIPMTMNRVQMGSRLVSWTNICSTRS